MQSHFLAYRSSRIHYQLAGKGKQLLIAFHGYSDSSHSFDFLEDHIEDDFTFIAVDIPFHGKTDWKEGLTFEPVELIEIIDAISKGFPQMHSKIYLLGFSMGGRIALSLLQMIPAKIDKIILLAPDGLHISKWYWLATQTGLGNALFRFTMKYPGWFFGMMHIGAKIKLISPGVYKFSLSSLHDKELRESLYIRWTAMRRFTTNFKKIKTLVSINKIPMRLIYGEYDHIIRKQGGQKFRIGIEAYCHLLILPCGHHILQEKNLQAIVRLIGE